MKQIELPPFAPSLIEATRSIGYSLESAIADIIDNSISADATNIDILFSPNGVPFIQIIDNGFGMDLETLKSAMTFGSKDPLGNRSDFDLGRFGLGLKTASFSQCKKLTVISKRDGAINGMCWDLDTVRDLGSWSVGCLAEDDMEGVKNIDRLESLKSGTLVVWEKLDKLSNNSDDLLEKALGEKMIQVDSHLSLVFHRYLSGETGIKKIYISMNNRKLEPFDPFFSEKSKSIMEEEKISLENSKIFVKPVLLPHPDKMTVSELDKYGGKEGLKKGQGFYVYRNKRLIVWGTWFRLIAMDDTYKLARVRVDIPNTLDNLWSLDVKKSTAQPPIVLREHLRKLVENLTLRSKETWHARKRKEKSKDSLHFWSSEITNSGTLFTINIQHPLISNFINELSDSKRKELTHILKLIENGFPIYEMYLKMNSDEKISLPLSESEISIKNFAFSYLSNATDENDLLEKAILLKMTDVFKAYPEIVDLSVKEIKRTWE